MLNIIQKSPFELLRNRAILDILDGDTKFGEYDNVEISMPYLSGPKIVEISLLFGLTATYGRNGGVSSRWSYLEDLIEYGTTNDTINKILSYLFSKEQFTQKLKGKSPDQIEYIYNYTIHTVIEKINEILYFGGNELTVTNNRFVIHPINSNVEIESPQVDKIDREYIVDIADRAMIDVADGNFDSAITKSRTLLEEVFFYVIEARNEIPTTGGNIGSLYKQVKGLYNMHTDRNLDIRINTLLSGLEKIVSSIAEMRNSNSDAHGVGRQRIPISEHHARLLVNSAKTMADFILSVGMNAK